MNLQLPATSASLSEPRSPLETSNMALPPARGILSAQEGRETRSLSTTRGEGSTAQQRRQRTAGERHGPDRDAPPLVGATEPAYYHRDRKRRGAMPFKAFYLTGGGGLRP